MTDLNNDFVRACEDLVKSYEGMIHAEALFDALIALATEYGERYVPQLVVSDNSVTLIMVPLAGGRTFALPVTELQQEAADRQKHRAG